MEFNMNRPAQSFMTVTNPDGFQYSTPTPEMRVYLKYLEERSKAIRDSLDYNLIDDVEFDSKPGYDHDYWCDRYIVSASYDGRDLTEDELDALNDDSDFVYSQIEKQVY